VSESPNRPRPRGERGDAAAKAPRRIAWKEEAAAAGRPGERGTASRRRRGI
jgi:hypothetical protein